MLLWGALAFVAETALAQSTSDFSVFGIGTFAAEEFVGGGAALGVRPGGRLRLAVLGAVGSEAGSVAGRGEIMAIFHLNPYRRTGWSAYGGGGVAVTVRNGAEGGYILALLGLESRPAGTTGWFVEVGVGGGVRAAAGIRLRRVRSRR